MEGTLKGYVATTTEAECGVASALYIERYSRFAWAGSLPAGDSHSAFIRLGRPGPCASKPALTTLCPLGATQVSFCTARSSLLCVGVALCSIRAPSAPRLACARSSKSSSGVNDRLVQRWCRTFTRATQCLCGILTREADVEVGR
jgi:hypothetical protein